MCQTYFVGGGNRSKINAHGGDGGLKLTHITPCVEYCVMGVFADTIPCVECVVDVFADMTLCVKCVVDVFADTIPCVE